MKKLLGLDAGDRLARRGAPVTEYWGRSGERCARPGGHRSDLLGGSAVRPMAWSIARKDTAYEKVTLLRVQRSPGP